MKQITVNTYRKDKYYPRVVKAVGEILACADVVAPSDILIEMGNLSKKNYEAWRKGQVPYLEQVFEGSLSKANRILRIIGFHLHDLNMVSRQTVYYQRGKGKNRVLRFSKSGNPNLEKAYSRYYVWNQSQEKKLKAINKFMPEHIDAPDHYSAGAP
ncbi:MAG: hypothetical protein U5L07_07140 [Desulfobacterales bacterium]|nr:hypothetical protein [Desulfobacterales bacterium]